MLFFLKRCVANVWNGMRHTGVPALIQQKLLTVLNTNRFLLHCWDKVCLSRIAFFSGLCIANKFALDHIAGSKGECCATPDASCSCWLGSRGWQRLEGHHAQNE